MIGNENAAAAGDAVAAAAAGGDGDAVAAADGVGRRCPRASDRQENEH